MTLDDADYTFVKVRRNLIAATLVVFGYFNAEVELSKLSIFGNEFLINDPQSIKDLLLVWLGYCSLRFYQLYSSEYEGKDEASWSGAKLNCGLYPSAFDHLGNAVDTTLSRWDKTKGLVAAIVLYTLKKPDFFMYKVPLFLTLATVVQINFSLMSA
jgi:hypothetical protein